MAKKNITPTAAPAAFDPSVAKTGPARNSAIPKPQTIASPRKEITRDAIAKRAFEISRGPTAGDEMSNWLRAERELKGL